MLQNINYKLEGLEPERKGLKSSKQYNFEGLEPALIDPRRFGIPERAGEPISTITGKPISTGFGKPKEKGLYNLEGLEPETDFVGRVKSSWKTGVAQTELGQLRYRQLLGEDTDEIKQQIADLKIGMPRPDEIKRGLPERAVQAAAEMLPIQVAGLRKGAERGLKMGLGFAGVMALAGQVGPQAVTPEEIITVPAAFAGGYGVGMLSGTLENIGQIEAGLAYDELLDLKDDKGNRVDPVIAKAAAASVGVINGLIEMAQIKLLLKTIPGGEALLRGTINKALKKAVTDKTLKAIALKYAGKYTGFIGIETGQEVLQESTNILANEIAKEVTNELRGTDLPATTIQEIGSRLVETAKQSALAFSVMGMPGTVVSGGIEAGKPKTIEPTITPTEPTIPEEARAGLDREAMLDGIKEDLETGVITIDGIKSFAKTPEAEGIVDDLNALVIDAKAQEELAPEIEPEILTPEARQEIIEAEMPIIEEEAPIFDLPEFKDTGEALDAEKILVEHPEFEPGKAVAVEKVEKVEVKKSWEMTKEEFVRDKELRKIADIEKKRKKYKESLKDKSTAGYYAEQKYPYTVNTSVELQAREAKNHKRIIQKAFSEGKSVPGSILAEYPDLKPPTPKPPEAKPPLPRREAIEAKGIPEVKPKVEKETIPVDEAILLQKERINKANAIDKVFERMSLKSLMEFKKLGKTEVPIEFFTEKEKERKVWKPGDKIPGIEKKPKPVTEEKVEVETTPKGKEITKLDLTKRYVKETGEKIEKGEIGKVKEKYPEEWAIADKAEKDKKSLWDKLPEDFRHNRGINEYTTKELKDMVAWEDLTLDEFEKIPLKERGQYPQLPKSVREERLETERWVEEQERKKKEAKAKRAEKKAKASIEAETGIAWIKNVQKPILSTRKIVRGKNKGKYEIILTKGRDAEGNIRPGLKKIVAEDAIVKMPLEKPTGVKPLFQKRTTATAKGVFKASDLQTQINKITTKWKNSPEVEVIQSQSELPENIQSYVKEEKETKKETGDLEEKKWIIDGTYYHGKVYIVADNMASVEAAVKTLVHESFGHYGLRGMLGNDFSKIMRDVYLAKRQEVQKIADEYEYDIKTEKGKVLSAEEWLAREAVNNPTSGWVKRVMNAIRKFVRRLMPTLRLSDAEIYQIIENARDYVVRGPKMSDGLGAYFGVPGYQMAGQKAIGTPTGQLVRTQKMLAEGKDKKEVWRETGWMKGVEGKWKFEIDDSGAKFNTQKLRERTKGIGKASTLGQLLSHDELYKSYPQLRSMLTTIEVDFDVTENTGSFTPSIDRSSEGLAGLEAEIKIKAKSIQDVKPTLLHEVAHAIQEIEGFAKGGSPIAMLGQLSLPEDIREAKAIEREMYERVWKVWDSEHKGKSLAEKEIIDKKWNPNLNKFRKAQKLVQRLEQDYKAKEATELHGLYQCLAGEIEARDTAARANLTPEQRREQMPYESQDIPEDQWIIAEGKGTSFSIEESVTPEIKIIGEDKTILNRISLEISNFLKTMSAMDVYIVPRTTGKYGYVGRGMQDRPQDIHIGPKALKDDAELNATIFHEALHQIESGRWNTPEAMDMKAEWESFDWKSKSPKELRELGFGDTLWLFRKTKVKALKSGEFFAEMGEDYLEHPKVLKKQAKPIFDFFEKHVVEETKQFATKPTKDYRAMLRKYQEAHTIIDKSLKDIPSQKPSKLPSEYEKGKDSWFGNKDWAEVRNAIERGKLQDVIRDTVSIKKNMFGKKIFDRKSRDVDAAIHLYLDLKRNPAHRAEFYKDLPGEWKRIVDKIDLVEATPKLKAIADYIRDEGDATGKLALEADVIHNQIENHVNRVWKKRAGVSEKIYTDALQKFKTKSRHAKHRVFDTILEGLALKDKNGKHIFDLQIRGATSNLQTLKDEISRVIEDKKLITEMRKMKTEDGDPLLSTHRINDTYVRIEHPNFKVWEFATGIDLIEKEVDSSTGLSIGDSIRAKDRGNIGKVVTITDKSVDVHFVNKKKGTEETVLFKKDAVGKLERPLIKVNPKGKNFFITDEGTVLEKRELYAPEKIARDLNKILGVSRLKGVRILGLPAIDTLTKYNAIFKSWILVTSFFHHQAFLRSYYLPSQHKTRAEWNPFKAYKMGKKAIEDMVPEIELLVHNGLTMFKMQDWEESVLRREDTVFGKILDKTTTSKAIKDKINELRERQANFLFGNFGAALKTQAALIELRNMTRKYPDMDVQERAKMVARLINDDFGGLHLGRMGRDPTIQHIMRLGLLAPDWTESNVRTMVKALRSPGGPEETAMYRRFWTSAITKGLSMIFVANILIAAFDDDDFEERYKKAWEAGHHRWLDIDVTPIYKMLGGESEARKYFSLFGHFRDPLKFIRHPIRSLHHKGSVVYGTFHEAMSGVDWKGQRFTTLSELIGVDDKGVYLTTTKTHKKGDPKGGKLAGKLVVYGAKGPISLEQMPSYIASQLIGVQPIQVQNLIAMLIGEVAAFDGIARSLGMHTGTTYPTTKSIREEFIEEFMSLKKERKSIVSLHKKVRKYNLKHKKNEIIKWSNIIKSANKRLRTENQ